jgi:hypothetical protein
MNRIRAALALFATSSRYPGVLIVSDGGGGDEDGAVSRASLDRWLSPALLALPSVTVTR